MDYNSKLQEMMEHQNYQQQVMRMAVKLEEHLVREIHQQTHLISVSQLIQQNLV